MALRDRLDTPPAAPIHGADCAVGALRQELPTDEQAALDRMLWELNWSDTQRQAELAAESYNVPLQTIGKHRRRQCRCFK